MLDKGIREKIEKATVSLPDKGGQGVVVPGEIILTATHCIEYSLEGHMVLGDYYLQTVEYKGLTLMAEVMAAEPRLDIAALGEPDGQECYKEAKEFNNFMEKIIPVEIRPDNIGLFQKTPAFLFTHTKEWVQVEAERFTEGAALFVNSPKLIEGGTSGGPIVDEDGRLIGIVSNFSVMHEPQGFCMGTIPIPILALPVWIVNRILNPE